MLDDTQEAPDAEAQDDAADAADAGGDDAVDVSDAGGDDAVDLADLGGEVETADEPAVTAEELMEIPDAPEVPGADELTEARANEAMELGAQAAQDDSDGNQVEGEPAAGDTGDA
ncbi:MAG: hypothetical protein QOD37_2152 [Gaiellales bacterium]|nr:hypothetical protein [Gaiellales bacterium]